MATVKEAREALAVIGSLDDARWQDYESDGRAGVRKTIQQRKEAVQADIDGDLRLENVLRYKKEPYRQGYQATAEIDEVDRGPLAGPVTTTCVILPKNCKIKHLSGSKEIPKNHHEEIYQEILARVLGIGVGIADSNIIDQVNIYKATKIGMLQAINQLKGVVTEPDYLLIDAVHLETSIPQQSPIKGDASSLLITAASIVTKVTRDRMMADYTSDYPGYAFEKNVGYGTKEHLEGLKEYGITPIHRKTFEPIKSMLEGS